MTNRSLETLAEREALLTEAERIAHLGSWAWNPRRGDVYWSDELYRMLGYDPSVVPSVEAFFAAIHPDDRQRVMDLSAYVGATLDPSLVAECRLCRADGEVLHVRLESGPVRDASGQVVMLVGTVLDLTPRVRAEQALIAAQRLEAMGLMAGGLAHDFNNVLQVIASLADRLSLPGAQPHGIADAIHGCVDQASRLTSQLLAFGRGDPSPSGACDASAVLADLDDLLRSLLGDAITLRVRVAPGLPPVGVGRHRLEQVLLNLATNARDAIAGTGAVEIDVDRPDADHVRLRVTDDGRGVPADAIHRIFEPFHTTKERGHGLGLASVYGIVTHARGRIRVEPDRPRGASFEVVLPVASAEPTVPPRERRLDLEGLHAVVVDDEAAIAQGLADLLRARGATCLAFFDPAAALAHLRDPAAAVDVLVTDVSMPEHSGIHLATEVAQRRPGAAVVLVTGHGFEQVRDAEELRPIRHRVLPKPVRLDDLVRAILELG